MSVSSSCGYTPTTQENVLPELSPEATVQMTGWVYISETCRDGSKVPVTIQSKDSNSFMAKPEAFVLDLSVTNVAQPRLIGTRVDRDTPGHSDGKAATQRHGGGALIELVTGLQTDTRTSRATMAYGPNELAASLIDKQVFTELPMQAVDRARGRFNASDDLDIRIAHPGTYEKKVQQAAIQQGWKIPAHAELVYATDTLLEIPSPSSGSGRPPEDCSVAGDEDGDGDADCNDTDCSASPACQPDPSPLAGQLLLNLIDQHSRIEATPTGPSTPDAVSAVSGGYDLVIDKAALLEQYGCLVNGIPLAICGEDPPEEEASESQPPTSHYHYRHYLQVPLAWTPAAPKTVAPKPKPKPKKRKVVKVVKAPEVPRLRIDAGFALGPVQFQDAVETNSSLYWDSFTVSLRRVQARTVFGKKALRPMLLLSTANIDNGAEYDEQIIAGGLATQKALNGSLTISPHFLLGTNNRTVTLDSTNSVQKVDYLVNPGVSLLLRNGGIGAFIGFDLQITPNLPWASEPDAVQSTGASATLGLSKYFF
jgi:hypothetical protein